MLADISLICKYKIFDSCKLLFSMLNLGRCMPSDQAMEKSDLLLKLGAVVDRVPPAPIVEQGNFVNRARNLAQARTASSTASIIEKPSAASTSQLTSTEPTSEPGAMNGRGFFTDQFENIANYAAHFNGTGPEIYAQCGGKLDAFVAGAGTGGTISGVALFLKPRLPNIKVILADPQGSGLFNRVRYGVMFDVKEREGTRRRRQVDSIIEGIGINRQTANFEAGRELIDEAIRVTDAQSIAMARWLVEKDGIFVGSSSAVNCEWDFDRLRLRYVLTIDQASRLSRPPWNLAQDIVSLHASRIQARDIFLSSGPSLVM